MLSYQHAYHAGNLADVHKHAILSFVLDYMIQKDKPLSYIETHSGRGLYKLSSVEAEKTGEAKAGILKAITENWFPENHIYRQVIQDIQSSYGAECYPGSPLIAKTILRPTDTIHLAEMHPQEFQALEQNLSGRRTHCYHSDGYKTALGLCPPEPRRGIVLIDPSYEVKSEYDDLAEFITKLHKKWPVGVIALWYPILDTNMHHSMVHALKQSDYPKTFCHEILFKKAHENHRMKGSGMFVINAPYGMDDFANNLSQIVNR